MRSFDSSLLVLLILTACGAEAPESDPVETDEQAAEAAAVEVEPEPEPEPEPDPGPPKRIFARRFVVPVRAAADRESDRIGYLRAGAVLQATTSLPVSTEGCREGWYELTTGGFVCSGRMVIAFEGRRLPERRSRQPSREDPLPYEYGFVRREAPMYRRPPTDEEAAEHEGYRIPGQEPPDAATVAEGSENGTDLETAPMSAMSAMTATEMAATEMTAMAATEMSPAEMAAAIGAAAMEGASMEVEGGEEEEEDLGPTLETLSGSRDSVVMRTMMRGFFVSLDRSVRRGARRYWRTQNNGFVPYRLIMKREGSDFHGAQIHGGTTKPIAFVLDQRANAYTRDENGRFRPARGARGYREAFIVAERVEDGRHTYVRVERMPPAPPEPEPEPAAEGADEEEIEEAEEEEDEEEEEAPQVAAAPSPEPEPEDPTEAIWHRTSNLRIAEPEPMREEMEAGDKWFDINLETQILVAYEGERAVYATLMSSGLPDRSNQPDRDYETLPGLHRVKSKHLTDTMDGDTAFDGPYSVDDVPYVMYYELAYALHTAFWHNRFGRPKSHGCVNLAPIDSRWLFNWADPPLPQGWHSAYPSEEVPGTWIWIHGDTLGRR